MVTYLIGIKFETVLNFLFIAHAKKICAIFVSFYMNMMPPRILDSVFNQIGSHAPVQQPSKPNQQPKWKKKEETEGPLP